MGCGDRIWIPREEIGEKGRILFARHHWIISCLAFCSPFRVDGIGRPIGNGNKKRKRLHKRGIKMAFVSEKQKGVKNFTCLLPRADCTLNKSLASLVSYALRARGELVTGWRGYIATREKTMYATSGERLGIFTR
ncbi:hypothetical protein NC652_020219 [Populus alba x Populus x berolinensis]|uniref:Uncharacterized protein n=1 Tax=Populus alba x Populus x berolinensis TaxID=444605 RepID=A0AAD6MLV8_9ROSI|nr:hypothetical protein NC652_020219 [Populus alba x Populus x berolinensis]KAJ6986687.1 hypothetical protein NC653_020037 [Populus alba x Populus x berolinensis]